jgi:hypothetical protein
MAILYLKSEDSSIKTCQKKKNIILISSDLLLQNKIKIFFVEITGINIDTLKDGQKLQI